MSVSSGAHARFFLVLACLMALPLGGCGRRGQLEPPPDPSVPAAAASDSASPIARRPKRVPIERPHESFILDPLL